MGIAGQEVQSFPAPVSSHPDGEQDFVAGMAAAILLQKAAESPGVTAEQVMALQDARKGVV